MKAESDLKTLEKEYTKKRTALKKRINELRKAADQKFYNDVFGY